ncbi:hypothetical protein Cgig2_000305 [Carnegiea gigantea]|uniref:V-SNARE coiled-coil homology domain-containing protein n=1 Tax=Carnegiea gigantea TaxID=171969 RepID=A0A9Q1GKS5_9CARY|nr:hypothetical protein Cgig2_000305 [Carnegiea gigantea]
MRGTPSVGTATKTSLPATEIASNDSSNLNGVRTQQDRSRSGKRRQTAGKDSLAAGEQKQRRCPKTQGPTAPKSQSSCVLDEYQKNFGDSWKTVRSDVAQPWPYLDDALTKFQDPAQADKILKIQRELDETKIILHKTIDSVLERGEKLDTLVEKSSDLSAASQMFYKQAKKTNQCCTIL